ncbi:centrosomin isoform X2 [Atheta coriaria]|uniref:centrosomin isoform X2 n=1 Tax=Dalotia coriaria TaxID=877792 RepID=UPI0031F4705B
MAQFYIKDVIKSMLNMNNDEGKQNINLQSAEDTEETSVEDSAGLRSPILGSRGRSIKEFEEQLSGLRKENFNLKLRIYFLEERMGSNMDQEDAVKKNIELMVELESLKKEVQEKQDLLCQAVKAMELEEDEHRKENEKKERDVKNYKHQLETIQQQYDALQEEMQSQVDLRERDFFGSAMNMQEDSQEIIARLESRIVDLEGQLHMEHGDHVLPTTHVTIEELQNSLSEREDKLREALCKLDEQCRSMSEVQTKLTSLELELRNKQCDVDSLKRKLDQTTSENKDLHLSIDELKRLHTEGTSLYETECKRNERNRAAISNRNAKITELEHAIEKYKTQVGNLELKLETAVNEVKSKRDVIAASPKSSTPKALLQFTDGSSISVRSSPPHAEYSPAPKSLRLQPSKSPNFKSKSNSVASADDDADNVDNAPLLDEVHYQNLGAQELCAELVKYKNHVAKLEQDQLKACRIIQTMLETRKKNGKEIDDLQRSLQKRDAIINDMRMVKIPAEKKTIQERVSELNLTAAAPTSDTERAESVDEHDPHLLLEQYKQFINELDLQKQKLAHTLHEKDVFIEQLERKFEELYKDNKAKENRIADLEYELVNTPDNESGNSVKEKTDTGNEKISFWIKESEEKDREIDKLEKELAKRTNDLQSVVNMELWQKNREIERLQKYVTNCDKKDVEIANLMKQIAELENTNAVYTLRIQELEEVKYEERNEIQEKLNTSNEDRNDLLIEVNSLNAQVATAVKENKTLKEELKLSDALRAETQEVCAILGKRLEELANFLDTLLKQKSVLGFLGFKQNKMLKQKVEESLDLSRNLSITLQMAGDQSLLQLSNISELLNSTNAHAGMETTLDLSNNLTTLSIVPDDISLTYQNHLNVKSNDQSEVIRVLRAQIDKLKGEVEIRDHELSQRMSLNSMRQIDLLDQIGDISGTAANTPLSAEEIMLRLKLNDKTKECDNSDSESWSEPDRDVSKARIGLDDQVLKPKVKMISESTEMEARPVSRTPSKKSVSSENRLTEQLNQKDELLNGTLLKCQEIEAKYAEVSKKYEDVCAKCRLLENNNSTLNKEYKDLDNLYQSLKTAYTSEREQFEVTLNDRAELQRTTKDLQEKLRAANEVKLSSENEVVLLRGKIENLESYKLMLIESMETKTKFLENRVHELEVEKNTAQQESKMAEGKLEEALKEIARIKDKLLSVEFNHAKSTSTLIDDAEKEVQRRRVELERDFEERVRKIEFNAQREVNRIREAAEEVANKYEKDYVEKSEMNKLKAMIEDLESVQDVLKLTEQKVRQLEASEKCLKQNLFDSECSFRNNLNELRRELDTATEQNSQLQLERTNSEEERTSLHSQLKQFHDREELFETQVADLKNDFAQLKDNFKRQLHAIETEKSHLEVKVSSLESLNADLQNQIVKLQCNSESNKSHSAPATPTGRILNMYLSKNQLYRQPNYHVNDIFGNYQRNNENIENVDEAERNQANSSPDLGIESDQGRFSSLDANIVSVRPLQPSIELAVSMSENFDQHRLSNENCGNDNCGRVVKEMHSENYLLKKKLQKSNKLLEDTLTQLAKANQRKREVEKNICKQIHKTSQVLKIAKANLDSGSDTELVRK